MPKICGCLIASEWRSSVVEANHTEPASPAYALKIIVGPRAVMKQKRSFADVLTGVRRVVSQQLHHLPPSQPHPSPDLPLLRQRRPCCSAARPCADRVSAGRGGLTPATLRRISVWASVYELEISRVPLAAGSQAQPSAGTYIDHISAQAQHNVKCKRPCPRTSC